MCLCPAAHAGRALAPHESRGSCRGHVKVAVMFNKKRGATVRAKSRLICYTLDEVGDRTEDAVAPSGKDRLSGNFIAKSHALDEDAWNKTLRDFKFLEAGLSHDTW